MQLLAKLDRLNISNYYTTVKVSIFDHYLHDSVKAIKDVVCFIWQDLPFPKADVRSLLDEMARGSEHRSLHLRESSMVGTVKNGLLILTLFNLAFVIF